MWQECTTPALKFDIAPSPDDVGQLGMLYNLLEAIVLTANVNVNTTVPDEFEPYLKWGVLADMLASDGQGCDPGRAAYCEQRWQEGIELARLMLRGMGIGNG